MNAGYEEREKKISMKKKKTNDDFKKFCARVRDTASIACEIISNIRSTLHTMAAF